VDVVLQSMRVQTGARLHQRSTGTLNFGSNWFRTIVSIRAFQRRTCSSGFPTSIDKILFYFCCKMIHQLFFSFLLPILALALPGKRKAIEVATSTISSLPTAIPEPIARMTKFQEEVDDSTLAPVLRASKPRGYASGEEMNSAIQFMRDYNTSEDERKDVIRRLTEFFDDDDRKQRKNREAGLPDNPFGYANSWEKYAASLSIRTGGNTRAENEDINRSILLFHSELLRSQREVDERRGWDVVIEIHLLPADIRIVYERFMKAPVDGEAAFNLFAEFFVLQTKGLAPRRSTIMDNFLIAVEQYEMRAYLVPDSATNAMNLVLFNLATARHLGRKYILIHDPSSRLSYDGFAMSNAFTSPNASASIGRSMVGPSLTISDAKAAMGIIDTVEVNFDVVEVAFGMNALLMFQEGVRYAGATFLSIMALKNLRQARSLLLSSLN
jgi:hypothetical protein